MILSIIVPDSTVVIDGNALKLPLTKLAKLKIHAVQFNDFNNQGHIEYTDGSYEGIKDLKGYEDIISSHQNRMEEIFPKLTEAQIKKQEERDWRNSELSRSDIELYKVQDGRGTGSVSEWREYRNELRDYPETDDFPYGERPKAP